MRKTIKGITYDTDDAIYLGSWGSKGLCSSHPEYWLEVLYKNLYSDGEFFLYGKGNSQSHYYGTEDIVPISRDLAKYWALNYLSARNYDRIALYFMSESQRLNDERRHRYQLEALEEAEAALA